MLKQFLEEISDAREQLMREMQRIQDKLGLDALLATESRMRFRNERDRQLFRELLQFFCSKDRKASLIYIYPAWGVPLHQEQSWRVGRYKRV